VGYAIRPGGRIAKRSTRSSCISLVLLANLAISVQVRGDAFSDSFPCHEDKLFPSGDTRPTLDSDQFAKTYSRAVFRVEIGDGHAFQGNAELISPDGYFLTAAHVVFNADKLSISQSPGDPQSAEERYPAEVIYAGTPGDTPGNISNDIALIKATGWNDPASPIQLRYSGGHFDSGYFIAFPNAASQVTRYQANVVTSNPIDPEGPFSGRAFAGRSGSLVVDGFGLGQGIVAAFNNLAEDKVKDLGGLEKIGVWLDQRDRFGVAVIEPGAPWLAKLPIDEKLRQIVDSCSTNTLKPDQLQRLMMEGNKPDGKYRDLPLYAIDRLYSVCGNALLQDRNLMITLKRYIESHMSGRCAKNDHIGRIYSNLTTQQKFDIGHISLKNYLDSTYSAPKTGTTQYSLLLESYLTLNAAASANEKANPSLYLDLATAKYELALAHDSSFRFDEGSPITVSILASLQQAKVAGAEYRKISLLATQLAVAQKDWDTAAAVAASQARAWDNGRNSSSPNAESLEQDITLFASKKAKLDPNVGWVHSWDNIVASDAPDYRKVFEFVAVAPSASATYRGVVE
jgi:hypothetical protein